MKRILIHKREELGYTVVNNTLKYLKRTKEPSCKSLYNSFKKDWDITWEDRDELTMTYTLWSTLSLTTFQNMDGTMYYTWNQ